MNLKHLKTAKGRAAFKRTRWLKLSNHPLIIPVSTFLVLFFVTLVLFVSIGGSTVGASDSHVVRITVDGKQEVLPTRAQTVGDLLERLNVKVGEKDIIEPALSTPIAADNFSVNVYTARPVEIIDNGRKTTTLSAEPTPRAVAKSAGITVYPEDKVENVAAGPDSADVIRNGLVAEQVMIERATPITINLYGNVVPARIQGKTVANALKEKSITLQPGDTVQPALDTVLTQDMPVFVVRVGHQVASVQEDIPMTIDTVSDPTLTLGTSVIREVGAPGKQLVTYEVELQNGQEVSRKELQKVVVSQPVRQLIAKGTKLPNVTVTGDRATIMTAAGIPADQHFAADYVISHESGWRLTAQNSGGCLGLGQACPGSKLIAACPNYTSDTICQLHFFNGYATGRYGSWSGAYQFWLVNHWW